MKSPSTAVFAAAAAAVALLVLALILFYGSSGSAPAPGGAVPPGVPLVPEGGIEGAAELPAGVGAAEELPAGEGAVEGEADLPAGEAAGAAAEGEEEPLFLPENQREVVLFFQSSTSDRLYPELRTILKTASFVDQAKQVIVELIAGPHQEHRPVLPESTRLRELYLVSEGTVCVDFSRDLVDAHRGGSAAELASVYAVVNSLTVNFPEIRRVRILIEGEERETLKHHVDLTRTFGQDLSFVEDTFL